MGDSGTIGSLPFKEGKKVKLTMSNSPDEKCDSSSCFWVADAFKLTWTGLQCSNEQLPEAKEEFEEKVEEVEEEPLRNGVLTLLARAGEGKELAVELERNRGVLQLTLTAHLGYSSVEIKAIVMKGRRLQGSSGSSSVEISFAARGSQSTAEGGDLMLQLQKNFDEAGVSVTVQDAGVEWEQQEPEPVTTKSSGENKKTSSCTVFYYGAAICGSLLALACGASFIYKKIKSHCCQKTSTNVVSIKESKDVSDLECAPAEVTENKANEKEDDVEIQSVSTDPPSSEGGSTRNSLNSFGSRPPSPVKETPTE
jgi:hypothetical protein